MTPRDYALLKPRQVAELLAVAPSTLCRWRLDGTGPREVADALVWLSDSVPRYRRTDILEFVGAPMEASDNGARS